MFKKTLSEEKMNEFVGEVLIPCFFNKRIVLLNGPMGSGKTSLVRLFMRTVGIKEPIVSPTFGYVQEYFFSQQGCLSRFNKVYHFDLYRLSGIDEFLGAGFDEFTSDPSALVFIEWPEVLNNFFLQSGYSEEVITIFLSYSSNGPLDRVIECF